MITRRLAAQILDIPLEMAARHGLPQRMEQTDLDELNTNPPQWLLQSRANRTGKRPVWVSLECSVCGYRETARPKKWWPEFTHVVCSDHGERELPLVPAGSVRSEYEGVGTRFTGIVDVPVNAG
ncbi:hypothetical protein [Arthrobacter sp. Helios]|uniref:hypothetical protein n=1 Tax=Arthrobacter sp. Helios TaxID=2828862 RepID=UPI002070989F|nr:hypothetical protein [Arthrobacter sp. Helios]UPO75561.1 hypothetical protein ArtHe_09195 [Arthrobacter sp. Helios]